MRFLLPFLAVDQSRMDGHKLFGAIISAPRLPQRAAVAENEKTVVVVSAKLFCQGSPSPERRVCFGAVSPRKSCGGVPGEGSSDQHFSFRVSTVEGVGGGGEWQGTDFEVTERPTTRSFRLEIRSLILR